MELWRHLRESIGNSDFDVKGCRRNAQLQRDAMLRIRGSLSIHDDIWVHLADFVDLDVSHSLVVHLTTHIVVLVSLARQHVIVDVCHL